MPRSAAGLRLSLVLHAHLPYVRHPEHEHFLEENWLFEAVTESYLPLLEVLEGLARDGVPHRVAMSLSPTLLAMLEDPLLQSRLSRYLDDAIALAEKERDRTRLAPPFFSLAGRALEHLRRARARYYEVYKRDLVGAFRSLSEAGHVELLTCGATHGFLPLMLGKRFAWRAQVEVALGEFRRHFGRSPQGFWLPECGYDLGVEEILAANGIRWFVVDTHGVLHAEPLAQSGPYAPILTAAGVAAFGRDPESSRQVWSAQEGYPADPDYREFHRDIGFDLPWDYIGPHLPYGGGRAPTGFKYHRITGSTDRKEPYDPDAAMRKAALHGDHFVESLLEQARRLHASLGRPPVVVAPYDAELFGHWWHEGPRWLDHVIRRCAACPRKDLRLATPSDVLDSDLDVQEATPSPSSWGLNGYNEFWLGRENHWIYRELHSAVDRMAALASEHRGGSRWVDRALNQAAREVLLAQASDWPFILRTGAVPEYARRRLRRHLDSFAELESAVRSRRLGDSFTRARLAEMERWDAVFPDLDYRVFRPDGTGSHRHGGNPSRRNLPLCGTTGRTE